MGKKKSDKKGNDKDKRKLATPTLASIADRHLLYQSSVQDVASEVDFLQQTFLALRKRPPQLLREDFCGTANTACEWVRRGKDRQAIGVDIDGEVLRWGKSHNLSKLNQHQQNQIQLLEADVFQVKAKPADIVVAMNFSYWFFKERSQLKNYFTKVRRGLVSDGLLVLDAFGGYEAHQTIVEKRKCDGFTYIWEHKDFNPITNDMTCTISFRFKDKSVYEDAFVYEWRFWSLPEIKELLLEAGFAKVTFYWQGWDEDGEPDGLFQPATKAEADAGWIAYIVAEK